MSSPQSLPPLSPTYQSSQLWAPQHLQRITIDQSHYHGYVSHTLNTHPPHFNAMHRRVQCYGDRYFHLHRDIPVHQDYSLTSLRLSKLRPWDQLVDRPLSKDRVLQKEFCQPFPAEHPYTSHISQFAVFPDTHPHTVSHTHCHSGTQTTPADLDPVPPYYVTHKASERGVRIEQQHNIMFPQAAGHVTDHVTTLSDHVTTCKCGHGQLWDLPRSKRRQRSKTYPAPLIQYTQKAPAPLTITPHTQKALRTIHCLTAGTTSYRDHFRAPPSPGELIDTANRQNWTSEDQMLRSLYSVYSHSRPYTAESRAKYRGKFGRGANEEDWGKGGEDAEGESGIVMKDAATQTEDDDEYLLATPTLQQDHDMAMDTATLPQLTNHGQTATKQRPKSATSVPRVSTALPTPGVGMGQGGMECGRETMERRHQRSFSVDGSTFFPRSSLSARRFTELYGFSRSNTLKRFHSQYLELAPDLRQYGIQKGKRHTIHGYNSYYFH